LAPATWHGAIGEPKWTRVEGEHLSWGEETTNEKDDILEFFTRGGFETDRIGN